LKALPDSSTPPKSIASAVEQQVVAPIRSTAFLVSANLLRNLFMIVEPAFVFGW
jgi:hypothetical protein